MKYFFDTKQRDRRRMLRSILTLVICGFIAACGDSNKEIAKPEPEAMPTAFEIYANSILRAQVGDKSIFDTHVVPLFGRDRMSQLYECVYRETIKSKGASAVLRVASGATGMIDDETKVINFAILKGFSVCLQAVDGNEHIKSWKEFTLERIGDQLRSAGAKSAVPHENNKSPSNPRETTKLAGADTTLSPSFDCKNAATLVEKLICREPLLMRLDVALAENYKRMLASNIGDGAKSHLRSTQKSWLSIRDKCENRDCIVNAYRQRVDEVCDYPVLSGAHPTCTASAEVLK